MTSGVGAEDVSPQVPGLQSQSLRPGAAGGSSPDRQGRAMRYYSIDKDMLADELSGKRVANASHGAVKH